MSYSPLSPSAWKLRKNMFNAFKNASFWSITASVDVSKISKSSKQKNIKLGTALLYTITKTANQTQNLRYRIKNDTIVCYDEVDVTVTHLDADKNVLFVHPKFHKDAHQFSEQYEKLKLTAQKYPDSEQQIIRKASRQDVIYGSVVPWIHFTSLTNSIAYENDCIPRLAWGKINQKKQMPFSIQANHRLVDGSHASQFYQKLQNNLDSF